MRWFTIFSICSLLLARNASSYNFVAATDTEHYTWTLNLISSIHQFHDKEQLEEIAVFDLGLKASERSYLKTLEAVEVYDIEKTNPLILEKFEVNSTGKIARGCYSWKPAIIKQASERFNAFFYLDSGITLLGPMDLLFEHLENEGYFFLDCGHNIERMTMKRLIKEFQLDTPKLRGILKQNGISAGFQGLTKKVYKSYVMPIYELSKNIDNFKDDGSCPKGFGWARHDQTLFSIQARLLKLKVHEAIRGGKMLLSSQNKRVKVRLSDFITISRGAFDLEKTKPYLRYKEKKN